MSGYTTNYQIITSRSGASLFYAAPELHLIDDLENSFVIEFQKSKPGILKIFYHYLVSIIDYLDKILQ